MEGAEQKEGKERVRQCLIEPLNQRGMVRKRGRSVEDHDKMLASLEARLAYMFEDRLKALAEVVERYASGPKKNIWPAEVSICNWAVLLQKPPASESRLVRSYLQSGAGDAAKSGGYLVELFFYLKKFGAPPNGYAASQIKQQAEGNQRKRASIQRDQERGRADARDLVWVQGYMDARRRCLDIINAKPKGAAA
ncbi:hypothetical protein GN241_11105 [Rhodobacteraceae bacterium IMCC1335]